jgi:Rps23 Pro-64 3,4-dihydroxylase Tpa1-like proline 4-hydroxylase
VVDPVHEQQQESPIDLSDLASVAAQYRERYMAAKPWPHLVQDGLVDPDVVAAAEAEEIGPALALKVEKAYRTVKAESPQVNGTAANHILQALLAEEFVTFLQSVTGIANLLPDPSHALAGLHVSPPGAFQALHRDFRLHPTNGLYHRVNVLVFLNSDWKPEFGGDLELWPADTSACGQRIAPTAGKMVIFETTPTSYHAIPDPVRCPPGRARLSLASYYYTDYPGPHDRRDFSIFPPKRPQDPLSIDVQKFKDVAASVGGLVRQRLARSRSDT